MPGPGLIHGVALAAIHNALAPGTNLPRGVFLMVGILYLVSLVLHRFSMRLGIPSALAILLLGLSVNLTNGQLGFVTHAHVETLHTVSLALLLFYAGLNTDLNRIRGLLPLALLLPTFGLLITGLALGLLLWALAALGMALPLAGSWGLSATLPLGAALLTAVCLLPTDGSTTGEMLERWHGRLPGGGLPLLEFEAALSSAAALLCFGLVVWVFQVSPTVHPGAMAADPLHALPTGLAQLLHQLFGGIGAGLVVGVVTNRLIPVLVRYREHLLLLAISVAFLAFALGNFFGGGGMVGVYTCGLLLANRPQARGPFGHAGLREVLLPFNTAAEFTLMLLLGRLVNPSDLVRVLPFGIVLALLLDLVLRPLVVALLGGGPWPWSAERLLVAAGSMRATLPVALSFVLLEQVPRLHRVAALDAEALASDLEALVFVVVVASLLLKGVLLPRLLESVLRPQPQRAEVPLGPHQ